MITAVGIGVIFKRGGGPSMAGAWILASGFWVDSNIWKDTSNWID